LKALAFQPNRALKLPQKADCKKEAEAPQKLRSAGVRERSREPLNGPRLSR
jgi:hypothetical protein